MIVLENFSFGFPQKDLYDGISFAIENGKHCALIGSSGSGKSTLVDMIKDAERFMYDGKLEVHTKRKIGFVSQFTNFKKESDITVFNFVAEEFLKLENDAKSLCQEMETSIEIEEILERYQSVLDSIEALGGSAYENVIHSQLNMAGLEKQKDLCLSELSGGEIKLIQIIKEMLTSPELLIMDEPDVFLDFGNLNSLKKLINAYHGTILIITHNRYLLDHCFDKIVHLEDKKVQEFDGNYLDYNFSMLQRKIELQELSVADEVEIKRNEKIIDRLRETASYNADAANGKSLHARVKIQERLLTRKVKEPFVDIRQPQIHFSTNLVTNDVVALSVKDYEVMFDEVLLEHVNFDILSTDKVALIGPNGAGKTTIFRDIMNGNNKCISIDECIEIGYLSQVQGEVLKESNTVLDEFLELGFSKNSEVKEYLTQYGFEEEILKQQINSLSGGEKNNLQLAKLSYGNANLLLLDEPTSHLDTYSQIALEEAINDYEGAVLMVSHDFYTIINCMDYILTIDENTIRKISIRKFRKTIYAKYFDRDYLLIEQKKKEVEIKIGKALEKREFEEAKNILEELEKLIQLL